MNEWRDNAEIYLQPKGQKLNMSGVDDAKHKYGFPLARVWPLQHGNNIVVNLKRSGKTERKKSIVHFTGVSPAGMRL